MIISPIKKDSFEIYKVFLHFWRDKYSYMNNLILLIKSISGLVASANKPIYLNTLYIYIL